MTPEEILALPAGPELDRLIAEKVMGWGPMRRDLEPLCRYSTAIADAHTVWAYIVERGLSLWVGPDGNGSWAGQVKPRTRNLHEFIRQPTPELVICKAALLAVEGRP